MANDLSFTRTGNDPIGSIVSGSGVSPVQFVLRLTLSSNVFLGSLTSHLKKCKSKPGIPYGAASAISPMQALEIKRRTVGPNDVLLDVLYRGICRSHSHRSKGVQGRKFNNKHELGTILCADRSSSFDTRPRPL